MKKLFTILLSIVLVATLGFAVACKTHNWAEDWSSDKNNHWHTCLDEGCDEISDKAPHVDENNDKVCDVCKYKMGEEIQPTPDVTLESITATYYGTIQVGAELNKTKLIVMAHYSDSSKNTTVKDYTIGAIDTSTAGEKTVTITYTEGGITKECTVKITVEEPQPITYALTYAANGGSGKAPAAEQYEEGAKVTLKAADTFTSPEGKEFDGWLIDGEKLEAGAEYTMPAKAVTATAQWKNKEIPQPTTYALTYAAGDGSGDAPAAEQLIEGAKITLKAADTFTAPNGKEFAGWLVEGEETLRAAGSEITMPAKALTITAQWKDIPQPTKYDLTYAAGDGAGEAPAVEQYVEGAKVTLKANMFTAPADKEFDGWLIGETKYAVGAEYTMPAKAVTVTAQWKDAEQPDNQEYTLTYAAGDGTGEAPAAEQVVSGTTVTLKSADTFTAPEGKEFAGWMVDGTLHAAETEITMPAKDLTITAQWKDIPQPTKYDLTYAAGDGTGEAPETEQLVAGAEITLPENMFTAPENKQFAGWLVDSVLHAAGDKVTMPASNLTITAQWKDIVYTVTFKNGDTTVAEISLVKGTALKAEQIPTITVEDNEEMQGWFCGTTEIKAGSELTENITAIAKVVPVYRYTVNYYAPEWDENASVFIHIYLIDTPTTGKNTPLQGFVWGEATMEAVEGKTGWYVSAIKSYSQLTKLGFVFHTENESIKHEFVIDNISVQAFYFNDSSDVLYADSTTAQSAYIAKTQCTIYYYAPTWPTSENVYLYLYAGESPVVGHWGDTPNFPALTAVADHDNWYSYTFNSHATYTEFGVIFMTADTTTIKQQIKDIALTGTDFYFVSNGNDVYADYDAAEAGYAANAEIPATDYTFYYYAPNWPAGETMYIYTYGGLTLGADDYHGNTMTAVDGKAGWYSKTYSTKDEFTGFGIIFHNQTSSIKHEFTVSGLIGENFYFVCNGIEVYSDYDSAEAAYTDNTVEKEFTIHIYAPSYNEIKVWMWGVHDNQSAGWPGAAMTKGDDGWFTYTFSATNAAIAQSGQGIIFSADASTKLVVFDDDTGRLKDPNALYFNVDKGNQAFTSAEAALA